MLHRLLLVIATLVLAAPALASGGGGHGGGGEKKKPEPGTTVEMPFLIVPLAQDGNLLGYAYVSSKMVCKSPMACIKIREKLAFLQDGFVREVNGKPLSLPTDPKELDKPQLIARLTAVAKRIVGGDQVVTMVIVEAKFSPLHPSDSTATPGGVAPPDQAPGQADAQSGEKGAGKSATKGATSKPAAERAH